jgi:hypothetical protein
MAIDAAASQPLNAATTTLKRGKRRKQRKAAVLPKRVKKGTRWLHEIRRFQKSTENLIPKAPFARLIKVK